MTIKISDIIPSNLSKLIPSGNKNNISLFNLLFAFIPFGTLYIRMTKLNYSIDKIYLELFSGMTPLSFIPMAAMYFGFVKPGEGKTKPYGFDMIFPMITQILLSLFIDKIHIPMLHNYPMFKKMFLPFFVVSIIITLTNLYRRKVNCKDNENDKKMSFTDYLPKAALDAVSENVASLLISIGLNLLLKVIPPLKILFTVVSPIASMIGINIDNIIQCIFWNLGFVTSYIIGNMINQDNLNMFCNKGLSNLNQLQILFTIIGVGITFVLNLTNNIISLKHL